MSEASTNKLTAADWAPPLADLAPVGRRAPSVRREVGTPATLSVGRIPGMFSKRNSGLWLPARPNPGASDQRSSCVERRPMARNRGRDQPVSTRKYVS